MASAYFREPIHEFERAPVSPQPPHSPWHSPVPYLFGGLAAMLGLIAFALLILACSYWKLSGYLDDNADGERDLEAGDIKNDEINKPQKPYEEKILVIMAGQDKPTFLATPVSSSTSSSRSSSFGSNTSTCTCDQNEEKSEMVKQGSGGGDHPVLQNENRETSSDQNC
ncbi:hypothetical protein TanjilG_09466 [Lupinus angustifolius]|uniref:Protein GLUTAMINE DUMPER 3 n=1 Tax=Lupinus angustifolius TaxID=3871 RepID=A0A4P1RVW5_LUPAN|nr:PREDICTED: protein GLUTAMINE DUMPER 3-like [Lupinus angustifolius]OIW19446.1 hypothetical protein TanjilG_09466 [Lupinus angustifolius]